MQVGGHPVFVLGSFDRRMTVYAQQVRALNLIYSLEKAERIQRGDKIAIIGGGVAGVTAAAGALVRGMHVTLFEKAQELLHMFKGCHTRGLHPRIPGAKTGPVVRHSFRRPWGERSIRKAGFGRKRSRIG